MAALGGGGILYEMCKKAMITKNYKVNHSLIYQNIQRVINRNVKVNNYFVQKIIAQGKVLDSFVRIVSSWIWIQSRSRCVHVCWNLFTIVFLLQLVGWLYMKVFSQLFISSRSLTTPSVKKYHPTCTTGARDGRKYLKRATIIILVKLCQTGGLWKHWCQCNVYNSYI